MPYIGNTVQNQGFAPAIDYFSGDGTTVTFTLSRPIASVAQVIVAIDNVIQNPSSSFTVAGNSITFTSAPLSGTNNIWVEYTSLITTYAAISQDPTVIGDIRATGGYLAEGDFGNSYIDGTIVDYVTGNARITTGPIDNMTFYHGGTSARSEMMELYHAGGAKVFGTTALTIPVGTTAERPGTPANGMMRMNTTTGYMEYYSSAYGWQTIAPPYPVDVLIVAGGGGGTRGTGSGGSGGGGLLYGSTSVSPQTNYSLVVGAGGSGGPFNALGSAGSNSTGFGATANGGGVGSRNGEIGIAGGSGGGAAGATINGTNRANTSATQTNSGGFTGLGFTGGTTTGSNYYAGSGGGGAGGVGLNQSGSGSPGGNGGPGYTWVNGTTYAGGGGGANENNTGISSGGSGGGGAGGDGTTGPSAGTANTGGGAGGTGLASQTSVNGGSGVVIIRYLGGQRGSGGTVTSSGGYTYHTFTTSGTFTA